ncbi:MAG: GAP family protein [Actinomycetota bacterium]|nr:GAP family protein [Actinomycetota bacterium]
MIGQAVGFAFLAALSPTALLVVAVYLGSARPRQTSLLYLAGAVIMSALMAVVVLVVLRNTGLNHPRQHAPRDGLRLGLGLLLLGAGIAVAVRKPRAPDPAQPQQGFVSRMVANPAPLSAFTSGILIFLPGVTFLAALQVIATSRDGLPESVLAAALVVVINVLLVWLPVMLHLVAPAATERRLKALNGWLRANGHTLLTGALVIAGALLAVSGSYGLVTGR